MTDAPDFSGLSALFFNGTLTKGTDPSHTDGLISRSAELMKQNGVKTEVIRTINTDMATGIYPDMTEYGYDSDEWPTIFERVKAADIVVVCGPIWLGDNSSMTKKLIERLYANSSDENEQGQAVFYGKVGGCLITGNEDGVKHCSSNVLYSLQHVGFTIPPQADAGWLGEIGPGPSYLDEGSGGPENDFTNKNLTFMTYNLMHLARLLKSAGGIPAYGNQPGKWSDGQHFGFDDAARQAISSK